MVREKLSLISGAILIGILIGFIVILLTSNGINTIFGGRVGGDYPAIYGAGKIILSGETKELYSPKIQEAAQEGLLESGFIYFPYPPFYGALLSPLALLPYKLSYFLFTVLSVVAVFCTIKLLARVFSVVSNNQNLFFFIFLIFYPMTRAIFGGQNTALSLLCLTATIIYLEEKKDLKAGIAAGLWLFKPHFALPLGALLLLGRKWRALKGYLIVALGYFIIGAMVSGSFFWPQWWIEEGVLGYLPEELIRNSDLYISLTPLAFSEITPVLIGRIAIAFILIVLCLYRWLRISESTVLLAGALSSLAIPLVVPHVVYYDSGLLLFSLIYLIQLRNNLTLKKI